MTARSVVARTGSLFGGIGRLSGNSASMGCPDPFTNVIAGGRPRSDGDVRADRGFERGLVGQRTPAIVVLRLGSRRLSADHKRYSRPAAWQVLGPHAAAVRFNDHPADGKTHPETLALRRNEGLEDRVEPVGRYPVTAVVDGHEHAAAWHALGRHTNLSLRRVRG